MNTKGRRLGIALILCLAMMLGGAVALSPAGASMAENWSKIWKKKIKPKADKRYYTKATSDAKYQAKGSYAPAGSSYTKAESDGKYAPALPLHRGTYLGWVPAGVGVTADLSFGVTLNAAPVAHYIPTGGIVPNGCSGTSASPNADPGHLCVFETGNVNVASATVYDERGSAGVANVGGVMGAMIITTTVNNAAATWFRGSWAVRPAGLALITSGSDAKVNGHEGAKGALAP